MMKQSTSFAQVANKLFLTIARLRLLLVMFLTLTVSAEVWGADYENISFSDIKTGDVIIIVGVKNGYTYAMINTGNPPKPATISVSDNTITTDLTNITFTATKNSDATITFVSTSSGTLYCTNANDGVKIGTMTGNDTKFTFDTEVNRLKNIGQNRWLGIYNTQDWRCYNSASATNIVGTATYFYRKVVESAHTITAVSNNETYGTVSVSGTTITASPNIGYTYANPAYTVTSGTATVIQNGNIFTVTPSSDCSIQINFAEKVKNTYIDNVQGNSIQTLYDTHAVPSLTDKTQATTGTCEQQHWHFMGWVTEANKENPTDENISEPSTNTTANGTTYYAVWAKGETTGGGTATTTFDAGVDNIAIGKNGIKFTMSNTTGSNGYYQVYDGSTMTISSDNPITSFIITCTTSGTSKYGPGNITFKTGSYSYSGTNGTWTGNSTSIASNKSSAQLRITKIVVTTSGGTITTYSDYITTCTTEPSHCLVQKVVVH